MSEIDRKQSSTPTSGGGTRAPVQRSAGKRSRVDGLAGGGGGTALEASTDVPMGALQLSAAPVAPPAGGGAAYDDPFALHLAARGVEGTGGALPHREVIQASFGKHDVSGISAHVGGNAAQASAAIGAEAYATGTSVAFATAPSLHLAAHEAAHVVQQRAGVSLKGGVGQAGDAYERHADAVADAVVAGRSAETLLDHGPGGSGAGPALQGHAIQRNQPGAAAPAAAPASVPSDAPGAAPESDGDRMRKAILAAAETRLKEKKEIVSEAEIQDIRTGRIRLKLVVLPDGSEVMMNLPTATPVKNFTTCIEFAGQTFGDASKAVGANAKDSARIAKLLPGIMRIFNEEFALQAQIDAFQKAITAFDKPIDKVEDRKQDFKDKKVELEGKKDGNKAHDKGIDQAIKGQDQAIKQLDGAIAQMQREQEKFAAKVAKLEDKKDALDAQDDALVRAGTPLAAHPKPGEYVLLGAGASQAYGVSEGTKVTLAKGSFKHIAVFKSHEPAPSPKDKPDEKWEKWHTIDGGGILAKNTEFYICLSDLRVQFAEPDKPWASSTTSLIGWIDMDKLMAAPGGDKP